MVTTSFSPFPYLETERLSLWQMEKADAADILALRSDERVNQYIDRKKMLSISEAETFIHKINDGIDKGIWIFWAVADRQTNRFLGTVCLWNIVKEEAKGELGYELLYDAQGHGYMMEAVAKVIEFGFQRMNLKVLEAVIKEGNERSIKLAENNGFTFLKKDGANLIYILEPAIN
ncbi:MAG: family N-acetyltransferase [Bacteroidetes bacterium]|nr:family N-acetyltransferase [Bacteroidota bacterium]